MVTFLSYLLHLTTEAKKKSPNPKSDGITIVDLMIDGHYGGEQ